MTNVGDDFAQAPDQLARSLYFSKFGVKSREGSVQVKGVLPMALKPCSYCGENIEEDTTVCPHCRTFGPFESSLPVDSIDTFSDPPEERDSRGGEAREGFFKGLFREIGCNCAFGCAFSFVGFIILVVLVVIVATCGGGRPTEFDRGELHDWAMDPTGWEDTDTGQPLHDFRILEITPGPDAAITAEHGPFCQAVAQTTEGEHSVWYESEDDGTLSLFTEPLP